MSEETDKKRKRGWLKIAAIVLAIVLAAGAGIGLRLAQDKEEAPHTPTAVLPKEVTDLERLRDSGDQAAFDAKLQETLNNPSLDSQTRYLIYIEQGHSALQAGEFQEAIDAYTNAWQIKQDKQAAALLGDAYAALGDKTKATEFYNKAITLIPADYPNQGLKREYENRIKALEEGTPPDD
jgi:tetratricopeptide (TPR) repeat protein